MMAKLIISYDTSLQINCCRHRSGRNRNRVIGIVTRLEAGRTGEQWFDSYLDKQLISFQKHLYGFWGPSSLLFSRHRSSFLGVKRPGHETNNTPHLLRRLRMSGPSRPLPHMPVWLARRKRSFTVLASQQSVSSAHQLHSLTILVEVTFIMLRTVCDRNDFV